jgi:hypothetical protein
MKKVAKALFILSVLVLPALLQPRSSLAQAQSLSLTWAFIVAGSGGPDRVLDAAKKPVIHSGERMRIVVERRTPCHVYLFLLDSHNELTLLYPDPPFFSEKAKGERIELPGGEEWYTVDKSTGEETFHLLVSSRPLEPLAKAARSFARKPESPETKAAVLVEIKKARRSHSSLASVVEKGVSIAGTMQTRSAKSVPQGEATEVEAQEFYAKTIRLRHE